MYTIKLGKIYFLTDYFRKNDTLSITVRFKVKKRIMQ